MEERTVLLETKSPNEQLIREILHIISHGPIRETRIYKLLLGKYNHHQISLGIMEILKNELVDVLLCPLARKTKPNFGIQKPKFKFEGELSTFKLPKSQRP